MNANSRMKSSGATDSSPSDGYTDDFEAEASSYFHRMFSGQLTIDAMIKCLLGSRNLLRIGALFASL
ncbi:hypothetical protein RHMOL_Rhmol04G0136900 [Rhododendron molle]|uniref:Uncharacterized protein n=1 Tax=Rhododendron molle TaxID=49168 RepID=A0ACC0P0F8_RHOML|nr:hypothetical protein RHMOL_Rhmol04G0136900 [Rhododendron molle]